MLADPSFLNHLKSIYPLNSRGGKSKEQIPCSETAFHYLLIDNPWYIVAAVGFCASNQPEAVADVFQYALKALQSSAGDGDTVAEQLLLARRFREVLFKAGLTCGFARVCP
jgi:endoribonuclease Dicer